MNKRIKVWFTTLLKCEITSRENSECSTSRNMFLLYNLIMTTDLNKMLHIILWRYRALRHAAVPPLRTIPAVGSFKWCARDFGALTSTLYTHFCREQLVLVSKMPCSEVTEAVSPLKRSKSDSVNGHEETKVLKFAKLTEHATTPSRGSNRAAGFDLYRWFCKRLH